MKVYLCGPINGCSDDEATTWRESVKDTCPEFECIDPLRRDYRGIEDQFTDEIVELDKIDVMSCDVVLVNMPKLSVGTIMEIVFAWMNHKPVVVVVPDENHVSPWLKYHSTVIYSKLSSATHHIKYAMSRK